MTLNRVGGIMVPLVLILGVCATGCFLVNKKAAQANSSAPEQAPTTPKVNPLGPLPGAAAVIDEIQLREVGRCYQIAADTNLRPPASLDDLGLKQAAPKLHQAIADGRIIVYWKANATNAPAGTSNTILAYDADVPTKGGAVVMLDGSARKMTAEQFKDTAKAGQ
jgi:hypothetical protein